jgi:ribonuclease G
MLPASYDMIESSMEKNAQAKAHGGRKQKLNPVLQKYCENAKRRKRIDLKDIPALFPTGSDILVQVAKDSIGTKGPKLSTNISIPGRYIVLLPFSEVRGVSRKIEAQNERKRLHGIIRSLDLPDGMGCICRTNGEDRKEEYFKNDLQLILDMWNKYAESEEKVKAPFVVYKEPNLVERTIRDSLTEEIDEIVVDDPEIYEYSRNMVAGTVGKNFLRNVALYKDHEPIFQHFAVEKQIEEIFSRRINLPGGGFICIDETEALIAIDVNSGSKRGKDHPETILHSNLEAAEEIARQLRLRNVGGLVVIDFIDMRDAKDRDLVFKTMKNAVENDSAKTKMLPLSRFGLMEMTRQRENESISDTVFDDCPYCGGKGIVKSATTMRAEIQRALTEILKKYKSEKDLSIRVYVHPQILASIKNADSGILNEFEQKYGRNLSFRTDPMLHIEKFRIVDPDTEQELK